MSLSQYFSRLIIQDHPRTELTADYVRTLIENLGIVLHVGTHMRRFSKNFMATYIAILCSYFSVNVFENGFKT